MNAFIGGSLKRRGLTKCTPEKTAEKGRVKVQSLGGSEITLEDYRTKEEKPGQAPYETKLHTGKREKKRREP